MAVYGKACLPSSHLDQPHCTPPHPTCTLPSAMGLEAPVGLWSTPPGCLSRHGGLQGSRSEAIICGTQSRGVPHQIKLDLNQCVREGGREETRVLPLAHSQLCAPPPHCRQPWRPPFQLPSLQLKVLLTIIKYAIAEMGKLRLTKGK